MPGALLITDWSIFPSGENINLFDGYRRSLGILDPLHVAPGHIFSDDAEADAIECILLLCLYFFWDALLIVRDVSIEISHDEWIRLCGATPEVLAELESELTKYFED